jgi:hypothetical protein
MQDTNNQILDDPDYRISELKKQIAWGEGQRYGLETTISSLRAILKLIVEEDDRIWAEAQQNADEIDMEKFHELMKQAKRMLKL